MKHLIRRHAALLPALAADAGACGACFRAGNLQARPRRLSLRAGGRDRSASPRCGAPRPSSMRSMPGSLPKPYDKIGFGGLKIEAAHRRGRRRHQASRGIAQRLRARPVDAVLGYVSSGDCLAVSPAAEELKKLLVLFDCGTPRIFEENKFKYVFRTAAHGAMDNVAMARYLVKRGGDQEVPDVGAINQDYAWGQEIRGKTSRAASGAARAGSESKRVELWPKFGAGQYGTGVQPCCRRIRHLFGLFEPVGRRSAGLRAASGAAWPHEKIAVGWC